MLYNNIKKQDWVNFWIYRKETLFFYNEGNKMKRYQKFLLVAIVMNLLIGLIYLNRFEVSATTVKEMEDKASGFIQAGSDAATGFDTKPITQSFTGLGSFLTMIGAGVMVAVVSYMGIKYLMSPPDKQAALKQQLIGVVVAGIVIFGAYGIWSAVLKVVSNF